MKIALITTHNANNYGAVLQTFATQEVLKRYGDVTIINYNNKHISRSMDLIRFIPTLHGILGLGKDIARLLPRYRVLQKFGQFFDDYFNLTELMSACEIDKVSNEYDVFVAGSDQIWNPSCISSSGEIDGVYFLDYVQTDKIKISYASSMGGYEYSDAEADQVKCYLKDFSLISVREKDTKQYFENLLERNIEHVLDPTLLLSNKEWFKALDIQNKTIQEKYILFYCVPKLKGIRDIAKYYKDKFGIKIIALDQGLSSGVKVDKHVRDAGPKEFIELFMNAEFVITDSFHGTCFSINFKKPFIAFTEGVHSNRIKSILEVTGLDNRLVSDFDDVDRLNEVMTRNGLEEGSLKLNELRNDSLRFLECIFESK